MNIANNIKSIRKAKGITPTMMASQLGIEVTNYPRLENRGNRLSYVNLENISKALGVTVIELLTWGEEEVTSKERVEVEEVQFLQSQLDDLNTNRRILQDFIIALKTKLGYLLDLMHSTIKSYGIAAGLGKKVQNEDGRTYDIYFTDEELYQIYDIIYKQNFDLYNILFVCIFREVIDPSVREAAIFLKHGDVAIENHDRDVPDEKVLHKSIFEKNTPSKKMH